MHQVHFGSSLWSMQHDSSLMLCTSTALSLYMHTTNSIQSTKNYILKVPTGPQPHRRACLPQGCAAVLSC